MFFCEGRYLFEPFLIVNRHISQYLPIQRDACPGKAEHKLAVTEIRKPGSGIYPYDPHSPHHPFFGLTIPVGK
jgi:hypothetical protein